MSLPKANDHLGYNTQIDVVCARECMKNVVLFRPLDMYLICNYLFINVLPIYNVAFFPMSLQFPHILQTTYLMIVGFAFLQSVLVAFRCMPVECNCTFTLCICKFQVSTNSSCYVHFNENAWRRLAVL